MLLQSRVPKHINSKSAAFGFDLFDCFLILSTFSVLNFLLSGSLLGWILSALIAVILRFGKKDKPDGYLLDLFQFYFAPKVLSASYPGKIKPYLKDLYGKDN